MAGPTYLVTLEDVKKHLNKTDSNDDTELQGFIDAATPIIENIAGPVIQRTVVEYYDGGQSRLELNQLPFISITSVIETYGQTNYTLQEVTLGGVSTGFGFTVDYVTGQIIRRAYNAEARFPIGAKNVQVTYVAGRASVPANVRLATLMLIQHLWSTSQMNRNGGRPSFGGDDSFTVGAGFAVPNRVRELLQPSPRVPGIA
jgi:hypothetical protein